MVLNILTTLKPLVLISQLEGFTLFHINVKTWEPEIKFWNIFFILKSIIVNITIHWLYWNSFLDFNLHGTKVVKCTIPKLLYCNLMSHSFSHFWLFVKRGDTMKMLKLANEIDLKLSELNMSFDYKNQQKKLLITLVGSITFVISIVFFALICVIFYDLSFDSKLPFIQLYGFMCCSIVLHHFSVGMIGIRHRFEKINYFLGHPSPSYD